MSSDDIVSRLRVLVSKECWIRPTVKDIEDAIAAITDLQNDLADALDLKSGVGPTVLTALVAERDSLRAALAERDERIADLLSGLAEANKRWQESRTALEAAEQDARRYRALQVLGSTLLDVHADDPELGPAIDAALVEWEARFGPLDAALDDSTSP